MSGLPDDAHYRVRVIEGKQPTEHFLKLIDTTGMGITYSSPDLYVTRELTSTELRRCREAGYELELEAPETD